MSFIPGRRIPGSTPKGSTQAFPIDPTCVGAVAAALGYMVVSSLLIILNKQLMADFGYHYPMAVAGQGMAFSCLAATLAVKVFKVAEATQTVTPHTFFTSMMPVGFFSALTLNFGNAVYMHLSVSLIQMLKAFCPVIVMLCLYIAGLETPTRRMITSVLIIVLGTVMASVGEVHLSALGLLLMVGAELAEAVRLTLTQKVLSGMKFQPMEGLMYLGGCSALWLLIGNLLFEMPLMIKENALGKVMERPLLYMLAASLGFILNLLALLVIKLSSALTLKVLGTAKNAAVVLLSVTFLGDVVTWMQLVGYTVSLAGFGWYNALKMAPAAPTATPDIKEGASPAPMEVQAEDLPGAASERAPLVPRHHSRLAEV